MHDDGFFDAEVAADYDDPTDPASDPALVEATVARLAALADGGPALELAIGTGRIALPLAARGIAVSGVDLSRAMVAQMRAKPGGADIPVEIGDMTTTRADGDAGAGRFRLVYLVFNTIMNLTTQDAQVACFENAARHLAPGGRFLIEVLAPDLQRLPPGEALRLYHADDAGWSYDEYDVATQAVISHHQSIVDGRLRRVSIPFRYVWPAELDLMARIAGLELESRWAGWNEEPFTADSRSHVSVWRRPD